MLYLVYFCRAVLGIERTAKSAKSDRRGIEGSFAGDYF
jgi:hypothetical protein